MSRIKMLLTILPMLLLFAGATTLSTGCEPVDDDDSADDDDSGADDDDSATA
jgi:hypothetical protein